ncbi:MAG: PAS domain S-box protein [Natronomonas sp.]
MKTETSFPIGEHGKNTISVLLVDDDEQWLSLLASDLEVDGNLETTTALSANEALVTLREDDSIECIVADYRMPEIDGLQLLERVRESHTNLPFILLTGMGSEEVASRAIRAGVSDYFRKDPNVDQVSILSNRIEQSVTQHRLQQELEESEQRYRTITEQIWEGIVVVVDGRIRFSNDRVTDLTGFDQAELFNEEFIERLVHPDDRSPVRANIERSEPNEMGNPVHEARLVTEVGKVLDCEYTLRSIPFETDTAILVSIRDITSRKNRERNVEREREINRIVHRAIVEARSREGLQSEIAAVLYEHGYDLVWIGETESSTIHPQAIRGDDRYVETVRSSIASAEHSSEPSLLSARTGEPQFTGDFTEMFATEWRDLALECGYRTGAAIPLRFDDLSYGILAVYHEDPHRIDDDERTLLLELSETLGFALQHLEVKKSLSSTTLVMVELELTDPDYYLSDLVSTANSNTSTGEIIVEGTHPYDAQEVIQYVRLADVTLERFEELAGAHPAVAHTAVIDDTESPRVQVAVSADVPELLLASFGGHVDSSVVTAANVRVRFALPSRNELGSVMEALEAEFGTASVRSTIEAERPQEPSGLQSLLRRANLTEKQSMALRAAYHHGYYEQPRKSSAKDIAESLGVVHSTYLQHLRVAQQKVFDSLYNTSIDR